MKKTLALLLLTTLFACSEPPKIINKTRVHIVSKKTIEAIQPRVYYHLEATDGTDIKVNYFVFQLMQLGDTVESITPRSKKVSRENSQLIFKHTGKIEYEN